MSGKSVALENWAGSLRYHAVEVARPTSTAELQEIVAVSDNVKALGSRHSFSEVADTTGTLVSVAGLPAVLEVDREQRCATVSAGMLYGALAAQLDEAGWALGNLASLPHISVAGAVATGTHGSGDSLQSLAAAVRALELVGADGKLARVRRGEPGFDGAVVSLGALGVIARLTLDIEPTYTVRQQVYTRLPLDVVEARFDEVMACGTSVSLFLRWDSPYVDQVWVKSRSDLPPDVLGASPAREAMHMIPGGSLDAVTQQSGVAGPWHERLPHFRAAFTPSAGAELQSEYLVPRSHAPAAIAALRRLGPRLTAVLQVGEIRTVAADDLWLSGSYQRPTVALHFTWERDAARVFALLPSLESALAPFAARPHWGKCFTTSAGRIEELYPRLHEFRDLVLTWDPARKFANTFLTRTLRL